MAQADVSLKVIDLIQREGLLQGAITVDALGAFTFNSGQKRYSSPEYVIEGITQVQIKIFVDKQSTPQYENKYTFCIKVAKIYKIDALKTNIVFSCVENGFNNHLVPSEDGLHQIFEYRSQLSIITFNVTLNTEVIDASVSLASLYDDTDLTDFELHGEGGSVPVHKAVLAVCSPVLKRMLSEDWKETKSGQVNISGTSKSTLEHLKSYMYRHEMPQSGFQQLLLLAAFYMMPGLERRCIEKLVTAMNPQNTLKLCEFAVQNKMDTLHLSILDSIQAGTVKVADIRIANMGRTAK